MEWFGVGFEGAETRDFGQGFAQNVGENGDFAGQKHPKIKDEIQKLCNLALELKTMQLQILNNLNKEKL